MTENAYFYLCRDGTIQLGDEIVKVFGHCLRGMTIHQVQELLVNSTKGTKRCDIDLVICRHVANNKEKLRKKSVDSYLDSHIPEHGTSLIDSNSEFASTALK